MVTPKNYFLVMASLNIQITISVPNSQISWISAWISYGFQGLSRIPTDFLREFPRRFRLPRSAAVPPSLPVRRCGVG